MVSFLGTFISILWLWVILLISAAFEILMLMITLVLSIFMGLENINKFKMKVSVIMADFRKTD